MLAQCWCANDCSPAYTRCAFVCSQANVVDDLDRSAANELYTMHRFLELAEPFF